MKRNYEEKWFRLIGMVILVFMSILCVMPLLFVISGSFTSEGSVVRQGFGLIPGEFSLEAYQLVFKNSKDLINAYGVSVFLVVVGGGCGLFLTTMTGYVLSRKDFKYRNIFSFLIYFTSVFSGGLVPWYLMMTNVLGLKNSMLALILPLLLNVFYIIVMKSFMAAIPFEMIESAKIDGAGEFRIFLRIILPVSKAALATIGVFIALAYWNDFYNAMLFISEQDKLPLQYYLYRMVNTSEALNRVAAMTGISVPAMPRETLKLAMTTLVVLPIMFVYPLVQKHIVGGVTIGAVKG